MPKVSIIIPVYNTEQYLRECLESVVNQTLEDIEIICIDDCSTDNSLKILEEYASKDNRLTILKQNYNQGVSIARNKGLDIAKGEYIMFLDSDDWYELNACEVAYKAIMKNKSDILIYGDFEQNSEGNITKSWRAKYIKECLDDKKEPNLIKLQMFLWDKIYKKSFLDEYNIRMPAGIKQAEDQVFNFTCGFYTNNYSYIDNPLITYRKLRDGSATTNPNGILLDLEAFNYLYDTPIFQNQSLKLQLDIVERFLACQVWNSKKWNSPNLRKKVKNNIKLFLNQVEKKYRKYDLLKLKSYRELKNIIIYKIFKNIFSITNSENKTHKIITLLGIKFKIKRGK